MASREGRGRMASGTRRQARLLSSRHAGTEGPHGGRGKHRGGQGMACRNEPFLATERTHASARDPSSNALPVDSCHVATRATTQPVR